jgi:hypothetical protein
MPSKTFMKLTAEVHQKTTSDILSRSLAPPWQLTSLTSPRFVRASVCWMLPAGPVSWRGSRQSVSAPPGPSRG